ncbi:hypothetical protein [Bifidobacterium apicola]|uniref:hypothetical protein n=1 Tax=Bifidobacterium apicola TaxID=3230739 RepID=UPI0036F24677
MSKEIVVALIAAVAALSGSCITTFAQHHLHKFNEAQMIQDAIADNQRLWLWNRQLVDHIYKGYPPPPPEPPADLFRRNE